ncbi:MAG: AAA family ATPase [Thermoplasmatota archaeon]
MALGLTLGMRILLHLYAHDPQRESYELPPELTQQGIAEALSVRQSDVSRALARLRTEGQVEWRSSPVGPSRRGRKQRLKVYLLSQRGREAAQALASRLSAMEVRIPPGPGREGERRVRLGDVNSVLGTSHPLVRLVEMTSPEGTLQLPSPPPAPAAQPPRDEGFVGRMEELQRLREWVRSGEERTLAIVGIPGVGKTALARALLGELGDQSSLYFQIREWASCGPLLKALRDFLISLGRRRLAHLLQRSPSPPLDEVVGAISRDIEGLAALIVLDDFHEAAQQPELRYLVQELSAILSGSSGRCRLLLLSRFSPGLSLRSRPEDAISVRELRLDGLDEESSRRLALSAGVPRSALAEVYRLTKGHPLSIRLLRGLEGRPGDWRDARRFLQEEAIGKLPAGEKALLQTLSLLRRPERIETVLALTDDPLAYDALSSLVSRNLVSLSSGSYSVHEMVREGAYERIPIPVRKEMHSRAAAHYAGLGTADGGAEAVYHLCRAGDHERAARLLLSLGGELISEGRLEECRALIDMVDSGPHGQTEGTRRLRENLLDEYGEWDAGYEYLFQFSVLSPVAGCRMDGPGRRVRGEREWVAALADHESSLEVLRRVGDGAGECELLISLGWMRMMRGEHDEAERAYRMVRPLARRVGCPEPALKAIVGLGHLAWLRGRRAEAAALYKRALGAMGGGAEGPRISCMNYLANLASSEREYQASARALERALALCGTGHRRERAYTILHLGRLQALMRGGGGAVDSLRRALAEFRGIGDAPGSVYALLALAVQALGAGDPASAQRWASEALEEASVPGLRAIRECAAGIAERARRKLQDGRGSG